MRVRALDAAKSELAWASALSDAEYRLGRRLLLAYNAVIEWASTFPHSGSPVRAVDTHHELRAFVLGHFPYTVVIAVLSDELVIVAVAHQSQEPGYWRDRLKDV